MLYRMKVLMALLGNASKDLSLVQIHKLMFLFTQMSDNHCYDFFPDILGCYSLMLHGDIHALEQKHLVTMEKGTSPFDTYVVVNRTLFKEDDYILKKDDGRYLRSVLDSYASSDGEALMKVTFEKKPFSAVRCQELSALKSPELTEKIEVIRKIIQKNHPRCLYTIGYEGRSLDGFLSVLIYYNIKTLVDVRKNAFSMRSEFCEAVLRDATQEAGLAYEVMSEVGIPSSNREALLPEGKYDELFDWYVSHVLPGCRSSAKRIADLVAKGNTALLCFEKDPRQCHRKRFADYCLSVEPSIAQVRHIVHKEEQKTEKGLR